ncbi:GIY-YIG nuclease family protein [candidate division CSSED10-310 bacterium]|uniref:GIY-YIG nuclease family protein n=1 Tax=candidate division CSSED10-310 bacterium TaxID=2855610 RepID=A0ABV6YRC9_UNCC1
MTNDRPRFHVYILQSITFPDRFYSGFSEDYEQRLREHNSGKIKHTSKFGPWRVKTVISFTDKQRAIAFENYIKSGSGRSFTKKRL